MYKLKSEEHNKELFIGKDDTAGFDDGITKEARITSPCGICIRGMVLYISEHPEKSKSIDYHPIISLSDGGPIEFKVSGNGKEFLDLERSYLYLKVKV